MTFETREMRREDAAACVAIINHIIAFGGTTAYEEPFSEEGFDVYYRQDPPIANVVLSEGRVVGFQSAFTVEKGIYSIGSFTDQVHPVKGAGRALIAKTIADARGQNGIAILAKITSDNTAGLAYYRSVGFVDDHVIPNDHTRSDGTVVDRIVKRFEL